MNVCILGNSLTSLSLAKALVNLNLNVDIISNKENYKIDESRTIGLTASNIEFFNKNILNINKLLWKIKKIKIYNDNLNNEELLNFSNHENHLFSIIKNDELYKLLYSNLTKSKFLKFKSKVKYSEYNLIVNCDPRNEITKKYFFKNMKKNYYSYAYTTIIDHDKLLNNDTAIQIFTKNGPLAFLPISNKKTSIVYSVQKKFRLNIDQIKNEILKYSKKYDLKKLNDLEKFELKYNFSRKFIHKNIVCFGDALHKIHPLAGQGFNMTVRDIKSLTDQIQKNIDLGLELSTAIFSFEANSFSNLFLFLKIFFWFVPESDFNISL